MKVLVIDCYDSFTYNLCQQIGKSGCEITVVKNDEPEDTILNDNYDRIVLSPGPGTPEKSGLCLKALNNISKTVPTLGICLGHQAICTIFGGRVLRTTPYHGKVSGINHDGESIFEGMKNGFSATRYHSLAAEKTSLPDCLRVTALSADDRCIMGVRHRNYPIEGVQFHPESILTEDGDRLIENFLRYGVRQ